MTTKTIQVDNRLVIEKDGWPRKSAFIVIWDIDATVNTKSKSVDGIGNYEDKSTYEIKYQGNYWGDKQMQLDGLPSRPLGHFVDVEAETLFHKNSAGEHILDDMGKKKPTGEVKPAHRVWVDTFTVDMDHVQSVQVIDSLTSGREERDRLITLDVVRKFIKVGD